MEAIIWAVAMVGQMETTAKVLQPEELLAIIHKAATTVADAVGTLVAMVLPLLSMAAVVALVAMIDRKMKWGVDVQAIRA